MKARVVGCLTFGLAVAVLTGADFPQVQISNDVLRAKLYLPDPERGYYRGTRFDWSGVIASLKYKGHDYFGPLFDQHDPKVHDNIRGPVEDFRTNKAGLGYDEAKAGDTFVKIGVGVLRKPEERGYDQSKYYEIVNSGRWHSRKGRDWVELVHELSDGKGYSYVYRKTVRLAKGKPGLTLEHRLRNTGTKAIETVVYDHNFFIIDGQPSGPDFTVKFPFQLRATQGLKDAAEVRGTQIVYLRELAQGEAIITTLEGFGRTAADYDIKIENSNVRAGVRITGDRPLANLVFWSGRRSLCPEPYINMHIEPGQESIWRINYEFCTLPEP